MQTASLAEAQAHLTEGAVIVPDRHWMGSAFLQHNVPRRITRVVNVPSVERVVAGRSVKQPAYICLWMRPLSDGGARAEDTFFALSENRVFTVDDERLSVYEDGRIVVSYRFERAAGAA